MEELEGKKGVKTKLFGAILIILGSLNCLLLWRGGFERATLFFLMIAFGLALMAIGSVRAGR